jgi:nitrate reductase delta subunit
MDKTMPVIYELLADSFEYPTKDLTGKGAETRSLLDHVSPEAALLYEEFARITGQISAGELEETYTITFDLQPICYPYVGYHLFGDDHVRGIFMAGLKERYRGCGISPGTELPDHISLMLRYLSRSDDDDEKYELLVECLLPAAEKMLKSFDNSGANPYGKLFQSLLVVLNMIKAGYEAGMKVTGQ